MKPAPFVWPVRVYWEDTDAGAGGVVYYANYLRFLERARSEWLRSRGFEQDCLRAEAGLIFVVRRVEIDYLAPARFNDQLDVQCSLAELRRASLVVAQAIERAGEVLARASVNLACVDAERFKPARILPALSLSLSNLPS